MKYKDNIEWLKSLKRQIGQTQHSDLWYFEQVIDETIENLKPLAKLHGRLIDADYLKKDRINISGTDFVLLVDVDNAKTIIEAEVDE